MKAISRVRRPDPAQNREECTMDKAYKIVWRGCGDYTDRAYFESFLQSVTQGGRVLEELNLPICEPATHPYFPLDALRSACGGFQEAAALARRYGMRVGINQWPAFGAEEVYAADDGHEMPFGPMVGYDGRIARRLACPTSPEFLAYTREKFKIYAGAGPDFIWIDDDCRFTHLGTVQYPCFCPRCVAGFEGGRFASREALVDALNQPENSALRRKWSEYGAQRLAEYCRTAREAVEEINPAIDVNLMTVGYSHTTFSGDYIEKCMAAAKSRAGRPGHGFYWDEEPRKMIDKIMEVARQVQRYPAQVLPDVQLEEDSCPRTPLNMAANIRVVLAALSIWAGCNGIAMNHLPGAGGSRPLAYSRYEFDLWRHRRAFMDQYLSFSEGLPALGIWVADNEFMAAGMDTKEKGWFHEDDPDYSVEKVNKEWPCFGSAISADPAHAYATLLQGKVVDTYSDEQIDEIFQKPVLLDGMALEALEKRGFGGRTGVRLAGRRLGLVEKMANAAVNEDFSGVTRTGIFHPTYLLEPLNSRVEILCTSPIPGAAEERPCVTRYGHVTVLGYSPYQFTGTVAKQTQLRNLLRADGAPVLLEPVDPYEISRVSPWVRGNGNRVSVLLVNTGFDPALPFEVCIRGSWTQASLLLPTGERRPAAPVYDGSFTRVRVEGLAPWDFLSVLAGE